jgi:hypothetical protein
MDTMDRVPVTDFLTTAGDAAACPDFVAISGTIDGIAGLCLWEVISLTDTGCISSPSRTA